jgi:F-type H+-transporting ATPase subunit epsilon
MAERLLFELVSPERLLVSEEVEMVVVPGTEGNFGVLKGHSLLISTLRPGVIDVYQNERNAITDRIFVAGGFAEVTPERCTVLADEAVEVSDLDATAVEANIRALEGARENLRGTSDDEGRRELAQVERDIAVAEAKLQAIRAAAAAH